MRLPITLKAAVTAIALTIALAVPAWADTISPAMVAQAGTTASFPVEITNQTSSVHAYTLRVEGLPKGTGCVFTANGAAVTSLTVEPGTGAPVVVHASVPAVAQLGTFEATFVARRDDGTEVKMPFAIDVESTFALKIASVSGSVSTFSGRDFSLDVTVRNAGASAVDNLAPAVDMPPKWVLLTDPSVLPSLAPGAEATFHLTVTVPASQVAIEQPVKVSVKSDQVTSPASDVKVRVQSNPVFLPFTIGLLVVALIGVVVYFRLKGRR